MPQLDPTWFSSQLFWLAISFGLLYLLLSTAVLPPLLSVIASRKGAVNGDLEAAQMFKSQAEHARQVYEHTLLQSREMAQALLNESEAASKARADEATKALEAQIAKKLEEAEKAIALKKAALMEALTPATVQFAAQIVEKLTHHAPTEAQVQRAISDATKSMTGVK